MAVASTPTKAGERLYTILEVAELWSVSRDLIEQLMRDGELEWVGLGSRRRIPASAVKRYQDAHTERASAGG